MSDEKRAASRRDFLKLAATGAPVVAVTTVAGTEAVAAPVEEAGEGLRKTEMAQKYYDSARF